MFRKHLIGDLELVREKITFLISQISLNGPLIEADAMLSAIIKDVEAGPVEEEKVNGV